MVIALVLIRRYFIDVLDDAQDPRRDCQKF